VTWDVLGYEWTIPQSTFHARHMQGRWQQLLQVPAFRQDGGWLILRGIEDCHEVRIKKRPSVNFENYPCPPSFATCFLRVSILVARCL